MGLIAAFCNFFLYFSPPSIFFLISQLNFEISPFCHQLHILHQSGLRKKIYYYLARDLFTFFLLKRKRKRKFFLIFLQCDYHQNSNIPRLLPTFKDSKIQALISFLKNETKFLELF